MAEHQEDSKNPRTVEHLPEKDEENMKGITSEDILKGAQQRTQVEHSMTIREALRKYPQACFFSLLFSAALIMEGFDKAYITAFFAFPEFRLKFGELTPQGDYQIPAHLQAGVTNGVNAGQIIGLLINGWLADRFGYRYVMLGCLFLMVSFIFLQFFATSIYMYMGAGILLGFPWGVFQTITTTYAAEVCPNVLRMYLTSLVSMCWSIGYMLGTGILTACLNLKGEVAYKIPFGLQWVLPPFLAIGIWFAPESPWWCVRRGRHAEAEKALRQLRSKKDVDEDEIADTLSMIIYTVKIEEEMKTAGSYWDLFKGVNLRRTEITVLTYVIQELCVPLLSYIIYFLQQSGVPTTDSFKFSIGQYALAIVGVVVAWFLAPHVGRRTLILSGTTFVMLTTFLIGFLGIPTGLANLGYGIGSLLLIQYFVFFFTCGPIIYTVVTEIPSNFLRTKSVALARATYNVNVLVYGQLVPRMIQISTWNWGPKSGFFAGGCMLLGLIWAFFRLPETKDRTFAEIDVLFKNNVPARKFKNAKVDIATQSVSFD